MRGRHNWVSATWVSIYNSRPPVFLDNALDSDHTRNLGPGERLEENDFLVRFDGVECLVPAARARERREDLAGRLVAGNEVGREADVGCGAG